MAWVTSSRQPPASHPALLGRAAPARLSDAQDRLRCGRYLASSLRTTTSSSPGATLYTYVDCTATTIYGLHHSSWVSGQALVILWVLKAALSRYRTVSRYWMTRIVATVVLCRGQRSAPTDVNRNLIFGRLSVYILTSNVNAIIFISGFNIFANIKLASVEVLFVYFFICYIFLEIELLRKNSAGSR